MKRIVLILAIILVGVTSSSCTKQSLNNENPSATVGDDEKVKEVPEDD